MSPKTLWCNKSVCSLLVMTTQKGFLSCIWKSPTSIAKFVRSSVATFLLTRIRFFVTFYFEQIVSPFKVLPSLWAVWKLKRQDLESLLCNWLVIYFYFYPQVKPQRWGIRRVSAIILIIKWSNSLCLISWGAADRGTKKYSCSIVVACCRELS